jgi:hypothetical protein
MVAGGGIEVPKKSIPGVLVGSGAGVSGAGVAIGLQAEKTNASRKPANNILFMMETPI